MAEGPLRRAVQPGLARGRRRQHSPAPRTNRINARFSDEELRRIQERAEAVRLAPAAYVAMMSLREYSTASSSVAAEALEAPEASEGSGGARGEAYRAVLLELLGLHRQMRGACTNLNQAVAKLNALGEPVGELAAIAAYVRRVTTGVDETIAEIRQRP